MCRKFLLFHVLLSAMILAGCSRRESVRQPEPTAPGAATVQAPTEPPATDPIALPETPPVQVASPAPSPTPVALAATPTPVELPPPPPPSPTAVALRPEPTAPVVVPAGEGPIPPLGCQKTQENRDAGEALIRGLDFYLSIITEREYPGYGMCGGWASGYSSNLKRRSGEYRPIGEDCVCIQYPGTPGTARSFLQGYLTLGLERHLEAARKAGNLLLAGANEEGGFNYEMWLGPDRPHGVHNPGTKSPPRNLPRSATMDDGVTQGSVEFLYELWLVTRDRRYYDGYRRGLEFYLTVQMDNGAIPQAHPAGGYHAYATFNDGVMYSVFRDLIKGYRRTGEERYLEGALRIARWVISAQVDGGAWGYQYNAKNRPAGARSFEPPAVGPAAINFAVRILIEAYRWSQDESFLQPIPGGIAWLESAQLSPGRWARFYHPGTTRPWYRTQGGRDLDTIDGAKGGYAWEGDWGLEAIAAWTEFQANRDQYARPVVPPGGQEDDPEELIMPQGNAGGKFRVSIEDIIASQDERGAFVKRGNIPGRMFCADVHQLVRYLRGGRGREKPAIERRAAAAVEGAGEDDETDEENEEE